MSSSACRYGRRHHRPGTRAPLDGLRAGEVAWFICAHCRRRSVVEVVDGTVTGLELAELLFAMYGEPPVCSSCQGRGS